MADQPHPHQLKDIQQIREFVFAGRARLTLVSTKTNTRFTYRVQKAKKSPERWYLSYLRGHSNEMDYTFVGSILPDLTYRHSSKSEVGMATQSVMAFCWFLARIRRSDIPQDLEVWHEGKCGRCGRLLTVPSSIERGIGPECAGRVAQQKLL